MKIADYIHFYLGRNTNEGKLVGILPTSYYIEKENDEIVISNKMDPIFSQGTSRVRDVPHDKIQKLSASQPVTF